MEYEITVGSKDGSQLIYTSDKHLFQIRTKHKPTHLFCKCHVPDCPAKIKIVNDCCSYTHSTHIHGTQELAYEQYKISDNVEKRCGSASVKNGPRTLFNEECQLKQKASETMQYGKRQRSFQRHQQKGIPKNPKLISDVKEYFETQEILSTIGKTMHENAKKFYQETVITSLFAYVIFSSEIILENLPPVRRLRIDGTFKVLPVGPFKQLLVISIELHGHTFPCFYVLMTRKTKAAYTHLLKKIEEKWKLQPISITTDYEKALKNSLQKQYPTAQLISCWFHFSQAVRRKAKKIKGFLKFLKSNDDARKLYRKFINLPLFREDKIVIAFAMFKAETIKFGSRFTEFVKYFEQQWMKKEGPQSICVYLEDHRTNNLLESYNSNMKYKIPSSGSFFKFVELLQSEELIKSRDYTIVLNGGNQVYPPQKKKYRERDEFINSNQMKFEKGNLSVTEFFDKMNELTEDTDHENSDDDEDTDDESNDENTNDPCNCVVCLTNKKSTMLEPCNHYKFCQDCIDVIRLPSLNDDGVPIIPKCPVCRAIITGSRTVYD